VTTRKPLPKRIYVERWPDEDRDDAIYYQPTGYGIEWMTGKRSTVTVYQRVTQRELAAERKAKRK